MLDLGLLLPDAFALIFCLSLGFYVFGDRELYEPARTRSFIKLNALTLTYLSWSCFCSLCASGFISLPYFLNLAVLSAWGLSMHLVPIAFLLYLGRELGLEAGGIWGRHSLRAFCAVVMTFSAAFIVINVMTGLVFTLDPLSSKVVTGPLFTAIPVLTFITCFAFTLVSWHNQEDSMPRFGRMGLYIPLLVLVVSLVQVLIPTVHLHGLMVGLLLFLFFMHTTANAFLVDTQTWLGNAKLMRSCIAWLYHHDRAFSIISVEITDRATLERELDKEGMDRYLRKLAGLLMSIEGVRHVFLMSQMRFALIGPAPEEPGCQDFCKRITSALSKPASLASGDVDTGFSVFMLPCPVVAISSTQAFDLLHFFSIERFDDGRLPNSSFSFHHAGVSFTLCDLSLKEMMARREHVAGLLARAGEEGLFEVEYQPVYDRKGDFTGLAECLVRLRDKSYERRISPAEFIPVAESEGYIDSVSRFVLSSACSLVRKCMDNGIQPPTLSVNYSALQFSSITLVDDVLSMIRDKGIEASRIKIEITESHLMRDAGRIMGSIDNLVEGGVGFFLDDFGSGYAGVSRYLTLPFECVKIDKDFLKDALKGGKYDIFLHSIVSCFQDLGCRVIFEGVEDAAALDYLASYADVAIQGFCFSGPMDEEAFLRLLSWSQ